MRDLYNASNSLISFEKFELAASTIVFLRKTIAYISAELSEDYETDREIEAIYWLKPFIYMMGGAVFDSKDSEDSYIDASFKEEIDVFVSLTKLIQYTVYLDGSRKLIMPDNTGTQKEYTDSSKCFREFLDFLLDIAKIKLGDLVGSVLFLTGSETSEIPQ